MQRIAADAELAAEKNKPAASESSLHYTASAIRRGGLRSATTSNLIIPRCRLTTYGTRAFSVAGPVCWNALPDYLKSSDLSFNYFRQRLFFYFVNTDTCPSTYCSALETLFMRSTNTCYLLTYLLTIIIINSIYIAPLGS